MNYLVQALADSEDLGTIKNQIVFAHGKRITPQIEASHAIILHAGSTESLYHNVVLLNYLHFSNV